ncbi:MAG: gamma-glutamylcyclotransferase [Candidatus Omnitrophica bacterium]|nr:gamma-glutamylcyclotransferase [Candidatus Omnitrophota bacterium]
MYYFAYGSNMNHALFFGRCPGATFIGPARLADRCLIFDGLAVVKHGATANMMRSRDEFLWGGVFEITEEHLAVLDDFEGYPKSFTRTLMDVERFEPHQKIKAWVYWREEEPVGIPAQSYITTILQGARDCHLPKEYIAELEPHKYY